MTEASKQIFWLDEMQLNCYGWNMSVIGEYNSAQKEFAGQAFTIMFWYKQSIFSGGHNGIIGIRTGVSGNTNGFTIGIESTREFNACQQNVAYLTTGHMISAGAWHHLAWTRDTTGTQFKAYIDGALAYAGTYHAQPGLADTIVFPNTAANACVISKLQINDTEFTAAEILADMQHPAMIQHKDTLRALYTEVKDGVLVDMCGTYSINMPDAVVDMGKFTL